MWEENTECDITAKYKQINIKPFQKWSEQVLFTMIVLQLDKYNFKFTPITVIFLDQKQIIVSGY